MRILFDGIGFQDGMLGGGVNRYCRELISRVADAPEMNVAVYGSLKNWPEGRARRIRSIPDFRVRETHRFSSTARQLNNVIDRLAGPLLSIREPRPDIFHLPYYRMPSRYGRIIVTLHDMLMELFPTLFDNPYCDSVRRQKRAAIAAAAQVICPSQSSRNDAIRFFDLPPERVSVTHLASSMHAGQDTDPVEDHRARRDPFILYVGSRFPHKNLEGLFRAFAGWEHCHEARLLCVGAGGPWTDAELKILAELDLMERVQLEGHVTDAALAELYRAAVCAVCPSLYEGFGLPVLEALQCGGIVCASQTSSLPEVGGDAAIYFDPVDHASIARALSEAANLDPARRQERIRRGLAHARGFSWQTTADQTLEVYRRVLANS